MDKILEVKKLKISFRTINGTVKAVRDISFDLERGETLAIVGESGSGKSVTSKAILGISAGNAIIDGGEILFDGKDLLKLSEEEMYKLRGDKIAMIFQDPLSSLNPIVKIGKQITEAMILKNRDTRRNARKDFNNKLKVLQDNMIGALGNEKASEIQALNKEFDGFNIVSTELENSYNVSLAAALEVSSELKDFLFKVERKQVPDCHGEISAILNKFSKVKDPFLTNNFKDELDAHYSKLRELHVDPEFKGKKNVALDSPKLSELVEECKSLLALIDKMTVIERPNFFRIGYYKHKMPNVDLYSKPIHELNEEALKVLDDNFMNVFLPYVKKALEYSMKNANEGKKKVIEALPEFEAYFKAGDFEKKEAIDKTKAFSKLIDESIDYLETIKDSVAYTFINSILVNIKTYFRNKITNEKEEKRYARQSDRYQKMIARGKKVDWKVVPAKIVPLEDSIDNICLNIERLKEKYQDVLDNANNVDIDKMSIVLIDYFKQKASDLVYKVTRTIAKERAIKLMEEVGIPEPRIRYYQYPFEFSGGMRQRIVIAIALSANPDILICDEPTTALDVTIQSQILELINKLKHERNLSVIFITHDLGVVANMADRIAVMYAGKIVEYGTSEEIFYSPAHPYTWALLSSMPDLDTKEKLEAIPGTPPNMIYPPVGDAFAARNKYALKIDFEEQPPLFKITDTHYAATWLLHPDAPKVEMPKIIVERIKRMKER